jgi:hypothetical protein
MDYRGLDRCYVVLNASVDCITHNGGVRRGKYNCSLGKIFINNTSLTSLDLYVSVSLHIARIKIDYRDLDQCSVVLNASLLHITNPHGVNTRLYHITKRIDSCSCYCTQTIAQLYIFPARDHMIHIYLITGYCTARHQLK